MKLFKRLLIAPATLGLLSPLAVSATEVNLNDVSNYSTDFEFEMNSSTFDSSSSESRLLAGGEGLVDDHSHDGSFSETTTASFSADMAAGWHEGSDDGDSIQALYGFQIDLNTSFTGEDSLDISIDAGNGGNGLSELDLNEGNADDTLTVDGVAYTFPLYGATVFVGDNMDGSTLFSTACVYGGPSNNLDDCGNGNSAIAGGAGTAAGASYEFADGFAVAVGYTGDGSSSNGLLTDDGADSVAGQISYAADSYGVSVTYALVEDYSGINDRNFLGLNGYFTPTDTGVIPSISVGYETGNAQALPDTTQWFAGLQWDEAGPGTAGVAVGTIGASTDTRVNEAVGDPELMMYEAFYSYDVNDGMTITPLIYTKEAKVGAQDSTGVMVKTSFSF